MGKLPNEIKMSPHARARLEERKDINMKYNIQNIMRSSVKWYGKDDLIHDCALYRHCCYTTRKSSQIGFMTDGDIEIIYNKRTHVAITVLEVKDKFKPITQFIKPDRLSKIKKKKEKIEMEKTVVCADCGKEEELNSNGICVKCARRMSNMKARGKEYVRYLDLSDKEKERIDKLIEGQAKRNVEKEEKPIEPVVLEVPDNNNYYSSKANQTPVAMRPMRKPVEEVFDSFADQDNFITILRDCGCEIPEENLKDVLDILIATDKLKDIFMTIAKSDNQQAMLDLEQALNAVERKLQHDWEYNGFQEADDIKFKGFLTWRRVLKGAIFFWKKLYQTNTLIEMQRAWNAYTQDPNDKILLAGDRIDSTLKRYQITTESISTIFNTKRPFTRVFYAKNEEDAHEMLVKWFADRQLHENKAKTVITELKSDGSGMYETK